MAIASRNKTNMNFAMSGMTDIVFLLLIFFMITSTLIVPGAMDVLLPQSNNQTAANPAINVSISRELEFYVDGEKVPFSELEQRLNEMIPADADNPTVRLNADESLDMDQVFSFLEIAKRNKYKVILGTRPE